MHPIAVALGQLEILFYIFLDVVCSSSGLLNTVTAQDGSRHYKAVWLSIMPPRSSLQMACVIGVCVVYVLM